MKRIVKVMSAAVLVAVLSMAWSSTALAGGSYGFSFGYSSGYGHHGHGGPRYYGGYRYGCYPSYSFGYTYYAPAPVYYYSPPPPPVVVYQQPAPPPVYYYSGGSFYRY